MMVFKFIDQERHALCVVLAADEAEARRYALDYALNTLKLPHANWLDTAPVAIMGLSLPGVLGWST